MSKNTIRIYYMIIASMAIAVNAFGATDLPYKEGELIVRFKPGIKGIERSIAERNEILSSLNAGTVEHAAKLVDGLSLVRLPSGVTVEAGLARLKAAGDILYVEPNYRIELASTFPNDTRCSEQWSLHNTGQVPYGTVDADVDAPEAWDIIHDAADVIVAVIDSGVDYTHPDLEANIWINPGEIAGNGVDDDGNGYIDDTKGYNFW